MLSFAEKKKKAVTLVSLKSSLPSCVTPPTSKKKKRKRGSGLISYVAPVVETSLDLSICEQHFINTQKKKDKKENDVLSIQI